MTEPSKERLEAMGIEQNEYEDFSCIKNFVFHSDIEDDESGDDKKLTSLVRESYVKRLRQLLKQNYKVWCENDESVSGIGKRLSSTEIDRCITFLEDKALQVCMVARIYQKVMVQMMSDIKKRTREMKLCESLINTESWNIERYPDKCSQTDAVSVCEKENQTDPIAFGPRYSLLDLPLPTSNNMSSCLEMKNTTPDSPCKQLKETVAKVIPRVINRSTAVQDGSSQQISRKRRRRSDNLDVNSDSNNDKKCLKVKRDSLDSFSVSHDNNLSLSENICETGGNLLEDSNIGGNLLEDSNIGGNLLEDSYKSIISDTFPVSNRSQIDDSSAVDRMVSNVFSMDNDQDDNLLSLDDRLMEMGLLNVEEPQSPICNQSLSPNTSQRGHRVHRGMEMGLLNVEEQSPICNQSLSPNTSQRGHRVHRGTWYVEMVAHVCNFHRAYNQLGDRQRTRIDLKMVKLFGTRNYDRSVKLCDDNLSLCRKRIASRVVAELTPYLDKKRIYSRHLFKEFAKRVTEVIMEESYAPESSRIKGFVQNFFERNKYVKSMIDIERLSTSQK